jgi:nitrite reductase/ring-hydroxylating ferredoxin subunit
MLVSFSSQGPLRNQWHPVAMSDDVQDAPLAIELFRDRLVIWRGPSGHVIAAPDRCTHRKADLSLGLVQDGCLVCPLHSWTFGEEGRCVKIPTRDVIEETAHLRTYGCEERYGLVWICLGKPRHEIPAVAADGDSAFSRLNGPPAMWSAPAPRIVEALLDQGSTDGEATFDIPFTYRRSVATTDGSDAQLLVTCSPVGAATSLVFPVLWSNGTASAADELLDAEIAAIRALKPTVEAVTGMFEIDENAPVAGAATSAGWRSALLEAVST